MTEEQRAALQRIADANDMTVEEVVRHITKTAKPNKICWSDKRPLLYSTLVGTFGPLETWEYPTRPNPGKGRDSMYKKFLHNFATENGAKSDQAVLQQIRYTTQANIRSLSGTQITCLLRNLLVAVEQKFITPQYAQTKLLEQAIK